jgi:integrase
MADAVAEGRTAGIFPGKPHGRAVVTGGAGTAARVVELLGGIWSWAERRGIVAGASPVRGVETARGEAKDRTLSDTELARLGQVLNDAQEAAPLAVAALRLVALTGLRRDEACSLRWSEFDEAGHCLRLEATKTGRSLRPIGRAAQDVLRALPQLSSTWVFPNRDGSGGADLKKALAKLFDAASLTGVRSHDLRRTFASVAADQGYSDATIGELLGHSRRGVTARHYIRRPDAALVAAADKVCTRIAAALDGTVGEHVELRSRA